jgi:hypothetical protein
LNIRNKDKASVQILDTFIVSAGITLLILPIEAVTWDWFHPCVFRDVVIL